MTWNPEKLQQYKSPAPRRHKVKINVLLTRSRVTAGLQDLKALQKILTIYDGLIKYKSLKF